MEEDPERYKDIAFILEKLPDTESSLLLERFFDSNTLLHVAASLGHDQIVEAILSKQQRQELLTAKNSSGDLPLHVALKARHLPVVRLLLESSDQCQELLTAKNTSGDLPLHVAVKARHLPTVRLLLESSDQCQELLAAKNSSGDLPLHVAVNAGRLPMVQLLVNSNVDVACKLLKEKNKEEITPLHLALINKYRLRGKKYAEVAKFLIDTGSEDGEIKEFLNEFRNGRMKPDYESAESSTDLSDDVPTSNNFVNADIKPALPRDGMSSVAETSETSISSIIPQLERGPQKSKDKVTGMDPELYNAVKSKNIDVIKNKAEDMERPALLVKTPELNTILHLAAASSDDKQFVQEILQIELCKEFLTEKNNNGDLPLHVAASAGNMQIVELLAASVPLMEKNEEENTPLHLVLIKKFQVGRNLALKAEYNKVAKFLVDKCPEVSFFPNSERKSPLYLAAEGGDEDLTRHMITTNRRKYGKSFVHGAIYYLMTTTCLPDGKSIAHAAIYGSFTARKKGYLGVNIYGSNTNGKIDLLDTVLEILPNDILTVKDGEGMTPLTYAASIGYLRGVESLLRKTTIPFVYVERMSVNPLHIAARKGHTKVVEKFLHEYPDMIELLTDVGENIFHLAAMNGKAEVLAYMLKRHDLKVEMLINNKDRYGNTPLHLATEGKHPMVVSMLTWDKRVDLEALNKNGERALDIALNYRGKNPSFRERLTREALRYVSGPRAPRRVSRRGELPYTLMVGMALSTKNYKDRAGNLLLVATLVATVTFAAAFTMPGGYKESGGMATFLEKPMFHVFVISNSIAMFSAITAVVTLIWAYLGDLNLFIAAYKFSVPFLGLAITMVSLSFMAGNYLVLRDQNWLAYLVLSIGSFFLFTLSVIFFPLCLPYSSPHPIIRYILRCPFHLLIKFSGCEADDFDERCEADCYVANGED